VVVKNAAIFWDHVRTTRNYILEEGNVKEILKFVTIYLFFFFFFFFLLLLLLLLLVVVVVVVLTN
jgi:hypothetical protein